MAELEIYKMHTVIQKIDEESVLCKKLSTLKSSMIDAILHGGYNNNISSWNDEFSEIVSKYLQLLNSRVKYRPYKTQL